MTTSIYDISNDFPGDLAAKLIAGANDTTANQDAYQVVLKSLHDAYKTSLSYYKQIDFKDDLDKWRTRKPLDVGAVQSADMQKCERLLVAESKGGTISGWLVYGKNEFEAQTFDRAELQRWLVAKGMVSAYRFAGVKAENTATPAPVEAVGALVEPDKAGPVAVKTSK